MHILVLLLLLWILPALVFICAAMLAFPATLARRGARRAALHLRDSSDLNGASEVAP